MNLILNFVGGAIIGVAFLAFLFWATAYVVEILEDRRR